MNFVEVTAESLYTLATEDFARNYFICYTINNHQTYDKVFRYMDHDEPVVGVFLRKTGIVQMALKPGYEPDELLNELEYLLTTFSWKQINISGKLGELVKQMSFLKKVNEGAFISCCKAEQFRMSYKQTILEFRWLTSEDLSEVIAIYQQVFKGFANFEYMKVKLDSKRGRAIGGFLEGKLVTVAQTDYESENDALIVGVATDPNYQGLGYGRACLEKLSEPLIKQGKTMYLQYDSKIAGKLYANLGFEIMDHISLIERISSEV